MDRPLIAAPVIVAIDGPAGAGKSTIARSVARRLGFTYIDSGAMYRSVGLWALRLGVALDDLYKLEQLAREARIEFPRDGCILLNGEDVTSAIRTPEVTAAASKVATYPGVRSALKTEQRRIGAAAPAVMEGRDIGTVVFPNARIKIFLDADPMERARRRAAETGQPLGEVSRDLSERDRQDRTREEAPLTQAPDADYLDTSHLTPAEVEEAILKIVRARTAN